MRDEKIADLLDDAEQLWIEVEGVVTHYRRQFTNARRLSAILKWGTIGAAALTALSAIPSASAASEIASTIAQWSWLTVILSVGTATVAALDQAFAPAKTMEALWKSITGLKSIQSSLQSFALEISRAEQTQDPAAVMKELRSKAEDISSTIHYDVTEEEKRGAKQAAEDTTLHKILQRFRSAHRSDEAVHDEDDRPIAAAADAGEIIAVTRRKA